MLRESTLRLRSEAGDKVVFPMPDFRVAGDGEDICTLFVGVAIGIRALTRAVPGC